MDEFKDFGKELRNRISNPFIFSFAVSWLFTNWPIPLAILLYSKKDLKDDGFETLHDLIVHYSAEWGWHMVLQPIIFAAIYTFLFPFAKAYIKLYIARITSKNETQILEETKQGSMPMGRFIKLRDKHLETIGELKKLYKEESAYLILNEELKATKAKLENDVLKANSDYASSEARFKIYKDLSNHGTTNGSWLFNIVTRSGSVNEFTLTFSDDVVKDETSRFEKYIAEDLVVNPFKNTIYFTLKPENGQDPIGPVVLQGTNSRDFYRLKGQHSIYQNFTMQKVKAN